MSEELVKVWSAINKRKIEGRQIYPHPMGDAFLSGYNSGIATACEEISALIAASKVEVTKIDGAHK